MWAIVAGAVKRRKQKTHATKATATDAVAAAAGPKPAAKFAPRDTQPIADALAAPGQLRLLDFTTKQQPQQKPAPATAAAAGAGLSAAVTVDAKAGGDAALAVGEARGGLRIVQWNIERGLQIHAIIHELLRLQPDIVILQELDVLCERTHNMDVPAVLGAALRMRVLFATEFVELKHKRRLQRSAVGQGGGVHGSAILTRLPVHDVWAVQHDVMGFDWERKGLSVCGEPRRGRRVFVGARIDTSTVLGVTCPQLLVYSCHLENNCGMVARYQQFAEVLRDINARQTQFAPATTKEAEAEASSPIPVVVGGDLNTIVGGLASLSGTYYDVLANKLMCTNINEAEFWERVLLAATTPAGVPYSVRYQFESHDTLRDPWHKRHDTTVTRSLLGGLLPYYSAKLDWLLLSRALHGRVVRKAIGGAHASDHSYLFVELH